MTTPNWKPGDRVQDEVSRWLTLERVGLSDLVKWSMFDNRDYWRSSDVDQQEWLCGLIDRFALGGCYDLANAVALETGQLVAIIKRRGDAVLGRIAHAVVYSALSDTGVDILGCRRMSDIANELRATVGPISLSLEKGERWPEDDPAELEELTVIAAGLPWFPRAEGRKVTPFAEFVRLTKRETPCAELGE